jgi:hypothetical protein
VDDRGERGPRRVLAILHAPLTIPFRVAFLQAPFEGTVPECVRAVRTRGLSPCGKLCGKRCRGSDRVQRRQ